MAVNKAMRAGLAAAAGLGLLFVFAARCGAEDSPAREYQLGPGDELQLSVLQQPTLDRALVVRPDGSVVVPLAGAVRVAGMTITEAEDQIRQKLRLFDRDISEVSLTVTRYNSLRIFVLGAVTKPGEYSFQSSPTLWDAVRAAGGLGADANPTAVRLVHQEGDQTSTQIIDISPLLSGQGAVPDVALRAGDTLVVPSRATGAAMASSVTGVQVIGGVATPGTYPVSGPTRLMTVLMLAGGPSATGELGDVRWVHDDGENRYRAVRVNVNLFLSQGSLAGNPLVHPGDTVEVPYRSEGFFRTFWPIALSTVTAVTAILLTRNH